MGFESAAPSEGTTKSRTAGTEWEFELTVGAFLIPADGGMVYPIAPKEGVRQPKGNTWRTAWEEPSLFVTSLGVVRPTIPVRRSFAARIMMSR
jgi:hypothetical protein